MTESFWITNKLSLFIIILVVVAFFLLTFLASPHKNFILGSQKITRVDSISACTVNCFAFNYSKSGGLGSAHDAILYKSDTNELLIHTDQSVIVKRQLSGSEIKSLKQIISDNVFKLNAYKPSRNAADFYNYTLTVLLNGGRYRASWTDASASVPIGLLKLKGEIEKLATLPK